MRKGKDYILFNIIGYIFITVIGMFTFIPFVVLVVSSFASENYIINHGYTLIPKEFSLGAYKLIFQNPQRIIRAYIITIIVTAVGTGLSLFLSTMAAYVMYRKDVKYRNVLAFFLYFTTLFNGGLASYYIILANYYHLKNNVLVLILVPLFNVFYILILRNFIRGSIPDSLIESAKIDGAGDFTIFVKIVLPLSKPALASIGLFIALNYWNDWWTPMMFIEKQNLYPLQYTLYLILSSVNVAANILQNVVRIDMPKETLKLAMTVVATGPIIFLYPFVQRYFVRGITLGAIKG